MRNQYSNEYFSFMKKLVNCNAAYVTPPSSAPAAAAGGQSSSAGSTSGQQQLTPDGEELAMITMQLASKFLFSSGFRTKKSLRGPAQEWYEILTQHFRYSRQVRLWFCQKVLFAQTSRFCEYILECPSAEVRTAFVRIIVFVAHFSLNDGPAPMPAVLQQQQQLLLKQAQSVVQPGSAGDSAAAAAATTTAVAAMSSAGTLSDHLLQAVLSLLWMEVCVLKNGPRTSRLFLIITLLYLGL